MSKVIFCVPTNVQLGFHRIPDEQPHIKSWRCELTALSRVYNLYFVACNDTIHVYQPIFPTQSLSDEPDLILHPPISSPDLEPVIDPLDPHSITRLHVDFLGREEIVLVTCDDGDVIGYRVPEIQRAIEDQRVSTDTEKEPVNADPVRVFLHRNVGLSAWGLAVHREARMIAISANSHKVTVIAYALADPSVDSSDSEMSEFSLPSNDSDSADFPSPRRRDHVLTLLAETNIPTVSFDNTGADPSGKWLASCSIDGKTHFWDLHKPEQPARTLELGYCVSAHDSMRFSGPCRCTNSTSVPHAAWGAMFVDPRSVHSPSKHLKNSSELIRPPFWDLTDTGIRSTTETAGTDSYHHTEHVEEDGSENSGSGMILPLQEGLELQLAENDSDNIPLGSESESSDPDEDDEMEDAADEENVHTQTDAEAQTTETLFISENLPEGLPMVVSPHAVQLAPPWLQAMIEGSGNANVVQIQVPPHLGFVSEAWVTGPALGSPRSTKKPYCGCSTAPSFQDQPHISRPCIIVTKEEIYLYQRPFDRSGDLKDPIMMMRNPLHPPGLERRPVPSWHRHCYSTQIPELGIFIVASPSGRAGIFSLTNVKPKKKTQTYGFELVCLLPFVKGQLNTLAIPHARLVGVAVGPVQGMFDDPDDETNGAGTRDTRSRRWRLMMMYNDHTVLSYELGKISQVESPELGDLVV